MNNLILCTYFYENSIEGANTLVKVCKNNDEAFWFSMDTLSENMVISQEEYDTIYHLILDKTDAETETATISFSIEEDGLLEYDVGGFRLTLGDETHTCRYDVIVEGLEVELS